jgi:hypothetical protein
MRFKNLPSATKTRSPLINITRIQQIEKPNKPEQTGSSLHLIEIGLIFKSRYIASKATHLLGLAIKQHLPQHIRQ